jgi:hypothetical protein
MLLERSLKKLININDLSSKTVVFANSDFSLHLLLKHLDGGPVAASQPEDLVDNRAFCENNGFAREVIDFSNFVQGPLEKNMRFQIKNTIETFGRWAGGCHRISLKMLTSKTVVFANSEF